MADILMLMPLAQRSDSSTVSLSICGQVSPTPHQRTMWTKAIRQHFSRNPFSTNGTQQSPRLSKPLARWLEHQTKDGAFTIILYKTIYSNFYPRIGHMLDDEYLAHTQESSTTSTKRGKLMEFPRMTFVILFPGKVARRTNPHRLRSRFSHLLSKGTMLKYLHDCQVSTWHPSMPQDSNCWPGTVRLRIRRLHRFQPILYN